VATAVSTGIGMAAGVHGEKSRWAIIRPIAPNLSIDKNYQASNVNRTPA
jgi:hypothetical protein